MCIYRHWFSASSQEMYTQTHSLDTTTIRFLWQWRLALMRWHDMMISKHQSKFSPFLRPVFFRGCPCVASRWWRHLSRFLQCVASLVLFPHAIHYKHHKQHGTEQTHDSTADYTCIDHKSQIYINGAIIKKYLLIFLEKRHNNHGMTINRRCS